MPKSRMALRVGSIPHKPHDGRNYRSHSFTTQESFARWMVRTNEVLDEGRKWGKFQKLREVAEITNTHSKLNGSDFYVTGGTFAETY